MRLSDFYREQLEESSAQFHADSMNKPIAFSLPKSLTDSLSDSIPDSLLDTCIECHAIYHADSYVESYWESYSVIHINSDHVKQRPG